MCYFYIQGKRHYAYGTTKRKAQESAAIKRHELEEGKKVLDPRTITVKKWAETCLDSYKTNVRDITLKNYKYKCNTWIIPAIGSLRLKDVKPLHCQTILNDMDGMATDTIRKVNQLLNFIFDKAVQNNMILENPAKYITIPAGTKETRRAITKAERQHVLAVAATKPRYVYFLFILFCGCRPSEVAELRYTDISITEGKPMLHIRGTKTAKADRLVPIPKDLYNRLEPQSFGYIFPNTSGQAMNAASRNSLWRLFKKDLNIHMGCKVVKGELVPPLPLAPDFVPYCLRHTYCTDLQKNGIDIRTAQYLMGHASIEMTANIYTHTDTEELLKVSDILDGTEHSDTIKNVNA